MKISFELNGALVEVEAEPDERAVDLMRRKMGLTGVKEACGQGECGACTVLIDGETRLSCLFLAAQLQGRSVVTIEGLGSQDKPHPLQESFVAHGAVQCGFCTPGMILSAENLLREKKNPNREDVRRGLSGNLCRCTGYQNIIDAVEAAAGGKGGGK